MAHQAQSKVIEDNPIGNGLDAFRSLFNLTCEGRGISHLCVPDALDQLDQEGGYLRSSLVARSLSNLFADVQDLASSLLSAFQILPASRLLTSKMGRSTLRSDLLTIISAVTSADFNFDRIKPLLQSALADKLDDVLIWNQVYNAVTESTPPPRPVVRAAVRSIKSD
jgi:hypothetical protein